MNKRRAGLAARDVGRPKAAERKIQQLIDLTLQRRPNERARMEEEGGGRDSSWLPNQLTSFELNLASGGRFARDRREAS